MGKHLIQISVNVSFDILLRSILSSLVSSLNKSFVFVLCHSWVEFFLFSPCWVSRLHDSHCRVGWISTLFRCGGYFCETQIFVSPVRGKSAVELPPQHWRPQLQQWPENESYKNHRLYHKTEAKMNNKTNIIFSRSRRNATLHGLLSKGKWAALTKNFMLTSCRWLVGCCVANNQQRVERLPTQLWLLNLRQLGLRESASRHLQRS